MVADHLPGRKESADGGRGKGRLHVGVVIPCFNAGRWVSRAVESALAQTYSPLDVVAVDDGSNDDTLQQLRAFDDAISVVHGPNRGACHARNIGFGIARKAGASHVIFLDADDYFEGELIAGMAAIATRTGADLVVGNMDVERFDKDGKSLTRERPGVYTGNIQPEEFFLGWMKGAYVNPSALFWSAEIVEAIEGWDESLWRAQDLDFALRAMFELPRIEKSEEGTAVYCRLNTTSTSRQLSERAQRSRFHATARLLDRALAEGGGRFLPAVPYLLQELYLVRVECLRDGQRELAGEIKGLLDAHGWRGHVGTPAHRITASVLGLETKVALARALRRLRHSSGE